MLRRLRITIAESLD